jgi:hypothetical protein
VHALLLGPARGVRELLLVAGWRAQAAAGAGWGLLLGARSWNLLNEGPGSRRQELGLGAMVNGADTALPMRPCGQLRAMELTEELYKEMRMTTTREIESPCPP